MHRQNGKSVSAALDRNADYILNPEKTRNGELTDSYQCQTQTAQTEFMVSKKMYEQITGRNQGKNDVIAYHIRLSFKPDEVTSEQVLELGKELAMRWTKGKYQFIVSSHVNTKNPHAHIVYNSVNLDCNRKFKNFKRSAIALRRLSDQICLEHGLSIIESPGLSKGYNRGEHIGEQKPPTVRDKVREIIDTNLVPAKDFEAFVSAMQMAGCEVKRGKHLAIKIPDGKRFIRLDSLGDDYTESALFERLCGKRIVTPKAKITTTVYTIEKPNLLIDIQEKMQQGYGVGFENWARIQNLKDGAKTLIFLKERGLDNYDLLTKTTEDLSSKFNAMSTRVKIIEARQKEITELQKNIGCYSKTKDVYSDYKKSKYSNKFYDEHVSDILICKAAKKYFDERGYGKDKKLPNVNTLKKEYAILATELKQLYSGFKSTREEVIALKMAKRNVDTILGEPKEIKKSYQKEVR